MPLHDMLLPEFDQEMANTRKMLEAIPDTCFEFQPHDKCWTINKLAGHIVDMLSWVGHTMKVDVLEMEPDQYKPFQPANRTQMMQQFDKNEVEARTAIASATDEQLNGIWSMKWEGKTVMTMPRIAVLRSMIMNHMIHHRAQLGVYLRLAGAHVPGMYGPSADEPTFGSVEKAA